MIGRLVTAGGFLILIGAPAIAADAEAPPPEPLVYDWSGFYLGAHVGYGEAQVDGLDHDLNPNGIIGGAHGGLNFQLGSFVLGAEGDFSWGNWEDSAGPNNQGESVSVDLDWLATLRARLGLAIDNFLIYGTVGAAWTDAEASISDNVGPVTSGSVDFDDVGLVAGGGVEWGMNERLSLRLEGLWFNFDDTIGTDIVTDPGDSVTLDDAWVVRTGISFNF
jgi:outer membrane immunogenic protein